MCACEISFYQIVSDRYYIDAYLYVLYGLDDKTCFIVRVKCESLLFKTNYLLLIHLSKSANLN